MKEKEQRESTPNEELPISHGDTKSLRKRMSPSSNSSPDFETVAMAKASARRRLDLGAGLSGQNTCGTDPSLKSGSEENPVSRLKPQESQLVHEDEAAPIRSLPKAPPSGDDGASRETGVKVPARVPSPSHSKRKLKSSNGENMPSPQARKRAKPAEEEEIPVFIQGEKRVLTSPPQKSPKKKSFLLKRVLPKFLRGIIGRKES
jgi:hypothetical protein